MKILAIIFTSGFLIYQVLGVRPYFDDRLHGDSSPGVHPYFDDSADEKVSHGVRPYLDDRADEKVSHGVRPYFDDEVDEKVSPGVHPYFDDRSDERVSPGVHPYFDDRSEEKISPGVRPYFDDRVNDKFSPGVRPYFDERFDGKVSHGVRPYFDDRVDEKGLYGRRHERGLKEELLNFLEFGLRYIMRNGNDTIGIPVLDVYRKDQQIVELDMREVMLDGILYDFTVSGLSNYIVIDGDVNLFPPKVIVSMNFPEIRAKGYYSFKGEALGTIPLFGEGKFDVVINDFFYDANVGIGLGGDLIKSLRLKIALGKLKLDVTGLFHDENVSRLLSLVISDMAPNFIRDFHDKIVDFVEPQVVKTMNKQLDGLSWKDLMEMLG